MSANLPSVPAVASTLSAFDAHGLPVRVRELLRAIHGLVAVELEHWLLLAHEDFQTQLLTLASQARNPVVQEAHLRGGRHMRDALDATVENLRRRLAASLASLRDAPELVRSTAEINLESGTLALVEDIDLDQSIVLKEIAVRTEMRNSMPLFLLCQRFGVLAAKPGFEAHELTVGPAQLARAFDAALADAGLNSEYRHLMLRQIERQMSARYGDLLTTMNGHLADQGVLPHITHIPFRAKPQLQLGGSATGKGAVDASVGDTFQRAEPQAPPPHQGPALLDEVGVSADQALALTEDAEAPVTRWPGLPTRSKPRTEPAAGNDAFDALRQLLSGRRSLVGKFASGTPQAMPPGMTATPVSAPAKVGPLASADDLQLVLERMQQLQAAPVIKAGKASERKIRDLKQDLLVQLRTGQPDGRAVGLQGEDNDTIELVGLLIDHLLKDIRPGTAAAGLLTRLQIPVLRVALADKGFFTDAAHPARQLLNSVAETADWSESDDPQDRALLEQIRGVVERLLNEFRGDAQLFERLLNDIGQQLQVQYRRAEVAEKRHVEAARGKEKLELARSRADEAIAALLGPRKVPRFTANLIGQSWADVLALILLRHGEESAAYRHKLEVTERLLDQAERRAGAAGVSPPLSDAQVQALRGEVEQGLLQIGYHAEEAQAAAARLVAASDDDDGDGISRTELQARLSGRARLGEKVETRAGDEVASLDAAQRAEYERLKRLPFGCWFDFVEADGRHSRRRMSWYSAVTGRCLFINHRGQRVGDWTLAFLAREISAGRVSVLRNGSTSLVDRAWQKIVGALRSFAGTPGSGDAA